MQMKRNKRIASQYKNLTNLTLSYVKQKAQNINSKIASMIPNSSIIKKRDDFKKEIRKDQLEKKRVDIRRGLPYYESMFNRDGEDGNSSRSSRFPVPGSRQLRDGNGHLENNYHQQEQQIGNQAAERQSQIRYVQYLGGLSTLTQTQRRQKITSIFTTHYGSNCFNSLQNLTQELSVTLMQYQNDLMDSTDPQSLSKLDWGLIEAALYFAENQQLPILKDTCLNLITKYMIPWCEAKINEQMVQELEVNNFLSLLSDTNEEIRTIEDILLSHFISLIQENQLNEQGLNQIINYFSLKFHMFQSLQHHLLTHYPHHSQTPSYYLSQLFYDYPSLFFMQSLASTISHKQTSTDTKLAAYTLLNDYFTGYPSQVQSQTSSIDKLKNFLSGYLNQITTFFRLCKLAISQNMDGKKYFDMIKSTLRMLTAIAMRDFNDEAVLVDMVVTFGVLVDNVDKFRIANNILEFLDIHVGILDCFTLLTAFLEDMNYFFEKTSLLYYLNALLIEWGIFKCQNRLQGNILETSPSNTIQFTKLEFFLIHCLYITKKNITHANLTPEDQEFVQTMFDQANIVYEREKFMIDELRKMGEHQTRANQMFLFEENINLYFKMLKSKEDVSNPENSELYNHQQDVEI